MKSKAILNCNVYSVVLCLYKVKLKYVCNALVRQDGKREMDEISDLELDNIGSIFKTVDKHFLSFSAVLPDILDELFNLGRFRI